MQFSRTEISAIVKIGILMSKADGHNDQSEDTVISLELVKFGINLEQAKVCVLNSLKMSFSDAIIVIKNMSSLEKEHVVSFLGTIMAADGKITNDEVKLCTLISMLCELPEITASDAINGFFFK